VGGNNMALDEVVLTAVDKKADLIVLGMQIPIVLVRALQQNLIRIHVKKHTVPGFTFAFNIVFDLGFAIH
jgi:hypothetical protein